MNDFSLLLNKLLYEHSMPYPICSADINGDGQVDFLDIVKLSGYLFGELINLK